jgi:hypothetical protein
VEADVDAGRVARLGSERGDEAAATKAIGVVGAYGTGDFVDLVNSSVVGVVRDVNASNDEVVAGGVRAGCEVGVERSNRGLGGTRNARAEGREE